MKDRWLVVREDTRQGLVIRTKISGVVVEIYALFQREADALEIALGFERHTGMPHCVREVDELMVILPGKGAAA